MLSANIIAVATITTIAKTTTITTANNTTTTITATTPVNSFLGVRISQGLITRLATHIL